MRRLLLNAYTSRVFISHTLVSYQLVSHVLVVCALVLLLMPAGAEAQSEGSTTDSTIVLAPAKHPSRKNAIPKRELYTLRYKPQLGTTLYDAETVVTHKLENNEQFSVISRAQLIWKNIEIDLKRGIWTFDRYFGKLITIDRDTTIKEIGSINKVSRLHYSMTGRELGRRLIDTATLSEDAQFMAHFFRAQRLMLPLPEQIVTYGAKWKDERFDTISIVGGQLRYEAQYQHTFVGLLDTLGGITAVITSDDTGTFNGEQQRPGEQKLTYHGPISGHDTTYLNLLLGRVVLRESHSRIPVRVEGESGLPASDILEVTSRYLYNDSNVRSTGRKQRAN